MHRLPLPRSSISLNGGSEGGREGGRKGKEQMSIQQTTN